MASDPQKPPPSWLLDGGVEAEAAPPKSSSKGTKPPPDWLQEKSQQPPFVSAPSPQQPPVLGGGGGAAPTGSDTPSAPSQAPSAPDLKVQTSADKRAQSAFDTAFSEPIPPPKGMEEAPAIQGPESDSEYDRVSGMDSRAVRAVYGDFQLPDDYGGTRSAANLDPSAFKRGDIQAAQEALRRKYEETAPVREWGSSAGELKKWEDEYNELSGEAEEYRASGNMRALKMLEPHIARAVDMAAKARDKTRSSAASAMPLIDGIAKDFLGSPEMIAGKFMREQEGVSVVDADKVRRYVNDRLYDMGLMDSSGRYDTSVDPDMSIRHMLVSRLTTEAENRDRSMAAESALKAKIGERRVAMVEDLTKSFVSADAEVQKINESATKYSAEAKAEVGALDDALSSQVASMKAQYERDTSALLAHGERINQAYQVGSISQQQQNQGISEINAKLKEAQEQYNGAVDGMAKSATERVGNINFRWNSKFKQEQEGRAAVIERSMEEFEAAFKEKFGEDPKFKNELLRTYNDAWNAQARKEGTNKAKTKAAYDRYMKDAPGVRQMNRFAETFVQGLGGAYKTMGITIGSPDMYDAGVRMENKFILPDREHGGVKDFLTVAWIESQGRLAGRMFPSVVATGLTAAATSPLGGVGAAGSLARVGATGARWGLSGAVGGGMETIDIAAQMRMDVLDKTGDIVKANKAADRVWDAQTAIWWSYLMEGAPFLKLPFAPKSRIIGGLMGYGLEFGQELLLQEGPQQIAEKRIMAEAEGKLKLRDGLTAAYDNFYEGVKEMTKPDMTGVSELEKLVVDLSGVGVVGIPGGVFGANQARRAKSDMLKSYAADAVVAKHAELGDAAWLNSVIERHGSDFALELADTFRAAGQLDVIQHLDLRRKIGVVDKARADASALRLTGDQSLAYTALSAKAYEQRRKAAESEDGVVKKVHEAMAAETERTLISLASGKDEKYFTVKYPDGRKVFVTEAEGKAMFADMEFVGTVAILGMGRKGGLEITAHGAGSDVALTGLWEEVVEIQSIMDRDIGAVNKRYGTVVDYTPEGIKVMAKGRPKDQYDAEALLHRLGYNVQGFIPQKNEAPLAEEDLILAIETPISLDTAPRAKAAEGAVTPEAATEVQPTVVEDVSISEPNDTGGVLPSAASDVLLQRDDAPVAETPPEVPPQAPPSVPVQEQVATDLYVKPDLSRDVADDPVALASAYMDDHITHSDGSTLDDHIGTLIGNNVNRASFEKFGDVSNITKDMKRAYLREEGGRELDDLAEELTGIWGEMVTPEQIVDYIIRNPTGRQAVSPRAREIASRYYGITGKRMNSLTAKMILGMNKDDDGNPIPAKRVKWKPAEQAIVDAALAAQVDLSEINDDDIADAKNMEDDDLIDMFGPSRKGKTTTATEDKRKKDEEAKQTQSAGADETRGKVRRAESPRPPRAADPEEERLAEALKTARAERDAFVNDFNDRGQGLFAPADIPTRQQTIDDTIDNSKENFDAKVEPLNERVRQAQKALADYVEKGADRAAAAAKQTAIPEAPAKAEAPLPKKEEKAPVSFKRPDPKPVTKPTVLRDVPSSVETKEYAIQGFEEYPVVVFKDKGGWKAVLRVGGLDMEIAGGQPTHGIAAGVAHEKMSRHGKKKLDDIVESLLKKGDGPMEMRATSLPPTITIDGKERSTTNSKGQPLALTEEGVRNFWKWFGDSKVVDEQGRPLVVYHGTKGDVEKFDGVTIAPDADTKIPSKNWKNPIFFAENPRYAGVFATQTITSGKGPSNVMPVYLRGNHILDLVKYNELANGIGLRGFGGQVFAIHTEQIENGFIDSRRSVDMRDPGLDKKFLEDFRRADVIVGHDTGNKNEGLVYVVRDPSQIKSATGNSGAFDPKSANINEQRPFRSEDADAIGFNYTTDAIARERFDIPSLEKIGSGSDRDVYDLGNGRVLKIAKTARGLEQNMYEGENIDFLPDAHEKGMNYVVVDKVEPAKASDVIEYEGYDGGESGTTTVGEMLKELSKFSQKDADNHTGAFQDAVNKYGFNDVMNYNILWNDFIAKRNWGVKDGMAIHLDGGTFGGVRMIDDFRGKKNLDDADFREIYNRSRAAKKAFGDTDKATMYQRPTDRAPKTGKPNTDKAMKALQGVAPGFKVIAPSNKADYQKAIDNFPDAVKSSWGLYDQASNTAYINPEGKDVRNTLFHESGHPLLIALRQNQPEKFKAFYESIEEQYKKYAKEKYSDKSENTQQDEAFTQFLADVADGTIPVSTKPDSLWQKFKAFIQDLLASLGWDTRSIDMSQPTNVREFAAQFKKAMDKGIKMTGLTMDGKQDAKLMLQDDADRLVDGWYSRLDQAVAAKGNTQSGADWLKWAEARAKEGALSMEEVKWTGLADFLQGKAKVTPKEVRDFLKENRVKVEVVINDGGSAAVERLNQKLRDTGFRAEEEYDEGVTYYDRSDEAYSFDDLPEHIQRVINEHSAAEGNTSETKFSQYQLPGGTNYREVLVTLPNAGKQVERYQVIGAFPGEFDTREEALAHIDKFLTISRQPGMEAVAEKLKEFPFKIEEYRDKKNSTDFRSSHFDEPNILVHLRLNDRTGPNGEKILFIEELQSDWGQQGKKKGFTGDANKGLPDGYKVEKLTEAQAAEVGYTHAGYDPDGTLVLYENSQEAVADALDRYRRGVNAGPKLPSAPFVTSTDAWVELGVKQAIRMAVKGGYDRIAWTTGEQQNERYDLSKQVSRVTWTTFTKEKGVTILMKNGAPANIEVDKSTGIVTSQRPGMNGRPLDEVVGKDMADKIMSEESGDLSGDGLKIGGSGMKGFYDRILPTVAKKVSKKLGGDGAVGEVEIGQPSNRKVSSPLIDETTRRHIEDGRQSRQPSIDITPAMRDRVGLGMPLMQRPKTTKASEWNAAVDDAVKNALVKEQDQAIQDAANLITDPDGKAEFIKVMSEAWGITTPPTGTKANQKKVSRVFLRDEILKAAEAGKRAGIADVAKARKAFVEQVKVVLAGLEGNLTEARSRSLITNAASVNPLNPLQVERFIASLETAIARSAESGYMKELQKAIDLSNPANYKTRRPSGVVMGRIESEKMKMLERIHGLIKAGNLDDIFERIAGIDDSLIDGSMPVEEVENELEALRISAGALSGEIDGAKAAQEAIKQIVAEGRSSLREVLKDKAEMYAKMKANAVQAVTGGKGVKSQFERAAIEKEAEGFLRSVVGNIHQFLDSAEGLRTLLDKMDIGKRQKDNPYGSTLDRSIYEPISDALNRDSKLNREAIDMLHAKLVELYGSKRSVVKAQRKNTHQEDVGTFTNLNGDKVDVKLSQNQAYYLYNLAKNPDNIETFRAMGWTDEMMDAVTNFLDPKVKEWADWQTEKFYPEMYKKVNKVYKRMNYLDLPQVEQYTPIRREGKKSQPGEATVNLENGAKSVQAAFGITPGALKERVGSTAPFDITIDGDALLLQHMSKMNHYVAYAEAIKGIAAIVGDSQFREGVRQNNNKGTLSALDGFVKDIAQQGVNRDKAFSAIEKLNGRMATSTLAISPVLTLKQMTAFPAYMSEMPIKDFVRGVGEFALNPMQAHRDLMESEYLKERFRKGFDRDVAIAMAKDYKKTFSKSGTIMEKLMWNVKYGDMGAILMGGYANYKYHYRQAKKQGFSEAGAKQYAIRRFEEATKLSQQSTGIPDLSHFQRGNGLAKMATLYMTQPMSYFRQERKAFRDMYRGIKSKDPVRIADATKRFIIYHVFLPALFQYVSNGLPGLIADWDDDDEEDMIRAMTLGSLNGVFLIGNTFAYMADRLQKKPWANDGPDYIPAFKPVSELGKAIVDVLDKWLIDENAQDEDVLEALSDLSFASLDFAGYPASRVQKLYGNYEKVVQQWNALTPEQVALLMAGYNEYTVGTRETSSGSSRSRGTERSGRPSRPSR